MHFKAIYNAVIISFMYRSDQRCNYKVDDETAYDDVVLRIYGHSIIYNFEIFVKIKSMNVYAIIQGGTVKVANLLRLSPSLFHMSMWGGLSETLRVNKKGFKDYYKKHSTINEVISIISVSIK